jgi:RNA polymerase sigma factor (sigma-70 family)
MSNSTEMPASTPGRFASTQWTVVFAAAQSHAPEAEQALEELCRAYRQPLYAFARRKGWPHEDAEDLTQQFFAGRVITKLVLKGLDPQQGKFRTWLLNSFQNFMSNERARAQAQKRGGDAVIVSVDAQDSQGEYLVQPGCTPTPEQFYDRSWGETVLERARARIEFTYDQKGERALFQELSQFLPGKQNQPAYGTLSAKLGLTEAALKMRVSRLRKELGQAVRAELKRTVATERDLDDELRYLRSVLST